MELGKYQNVLRAIKRKSGGLRTVVYDPSIDDTTVDFPDIEQPKMEFAGGGAVKKIIKRILSPDGLRQLGKKEGIPEEDIEKFLKGEYGLLPRGQARGVVRRDKDGNIFVKDTYSKKYDPIRKQMLKDDPGMFDDLFDRMFGEYELEQFKKSGRKPNADGGVVQREKFSKGPPRPLPEGYGTVEQFFEKAKQKGISLKSLRSFSNNSGRFTKKYNIKTKVNPYDKSANIYDLTALDNQEKVDEILKAQVKGPSKKTPEIKKFIQGSEGKLKRSKEYQKQKKIMSGYRVEKILEGDPQTVKSHMTSLKNQFQSPEMISYAPADTNNKFNKVLEKEINQVIKAQNNLLEKKPKGWKSTFNKLNEYGIELAAASDGEKAFSIRNYDGSFGYTFGAKTGVDTTDIFEGMTMKDIDEIYKKKNKTPDELMKIKLFEKNKDDLFENISKNAKPKTSQEARVIINNLKKIKPQDAIDAISNLACKNKYTDGSRVKFKKGSNCFLRGAEIIQDAKAGNPSALQKVRKYLKTPAARVGLGALVELGIEGLFAVESIAEGKPYDQVLGESIFGLVGFGSTEEEQILKHADPKDIENVKAYQKKLANESKLDANVGFEKTVQPETGEESTEDFFTVESLRPAMDKQRKQLEKDFLDPNLNTEEEAYGRAYRNYIEANKERAESGDFGRTLTQSIKKNIYDPAGEKIMQAYEAVENLFAEGGRVGMSEGGDPKDKMKTPFDKPTLPIDPNQIPQVQSPGRRGFIKGVGVISAGIAAFAAGLLRLGRKESAKKLVQKAATYGGRRIDGVPEIILDLITNIKTRGKIIDAPKPGSGPVVYRYNNYEYAEDVNGFTVSKINDQGDYGYSEEVFQFEKDLETGATFFDDVTVRPDGDGKLKDVEYGVDYDAYNEIADDLHKMNKLNPNDTRFRDKARKFIDEERLKNEGIEPKPGTEIYE